MFPEGTRRYARGFGIPRPGVGLLATQAQVPVIPTYVHNTHRVLRFSRLGVYFGAPLPPPDRSENEKEAYLRFSATVLERIKALKAQHTTELKSERVGELKQWRLWLQNRQDFVSG